MATRTRTRKSEAAAQPVERIANDDSKFLDTFAAGDVAHQGDLIIVAIASVPKSATPRKSRQLAEGDTQGSRHMMSRGDIFSADQGEVAGYILEATRKAGHPCVVPKEYIGPVFVSPANPTADDLSHPEHGNLGFPAGTVCAFVYQRNLDAEEREVRTRD